MPALCPGTRFSSVRRRTDEPPSNREITLPQENVGYRDAYVGHRTEPGHAQGDDVPSTTHEERSYVLYTIAVVLIILWLLGLVSAYTMGGFIHVLLVIAVVVILLRVISGRPAV